MWNHAPAMWRKMQETGAAFPVLTERDVTDIFAYLYVLRYMDVAGDPESGRQLLRDKGCIRCHAVRGEGGTAAPDLGRAEALPRTLISMVGLMWNHFPKMSKVMREKGVERPQFSEREMADLIAYLYSVRYFDEPGDISAGAQVFSEKQCDLCHALEGEKKEGPDLSRLRGRFSPARMAYAMWEHGPQMLDKMRSRNIPWSFFKGREVADLIAYLNAANDR